MKIMCSLVVAAVIGCGSDPKSQSDAPGTTDGANTVDAALDARVVPATTFDCIYGWAFEVDGATGAATVEGPFSSLGVCIKQSRYTDNLGVPRKSCDQLPANADPAMDQAFQAGCRPLAVHPAAARGKISNLSNYVRVAYPPLETAKLQRSNSGSSNFAPCDPLAQTGCAIAEKCTWIIDVNTPGNPTGHIGCAATGPKLLGDACMIGSGGATATGFDNCTKGLACNSGVCKTVCNNMGGVPSCGNGRLCANYAGLFGNQGESAAAGVCDATCNPLTQKTSNGEVACASANPAQPTKGCYGFWASNSKSRFTCSPIVDATRKQDFVIAPNQAFTNSCAPGFFSLIIMGTGSNNTICSAHCNPTDVYQGHSAGKGGVLLPGEPNTLATCGDRGAL
jgi:hypothetical protein